MGAEIRARIVQAVREGPVEVDFTGVELASEAFLDEGIARLVEQVPTSLLRERCQISNANQMVMAMLRVALRERRRVQTPRAKATAEPLR